MPDEVLVVRTPWTGEYKLCCEPFGEVTGLLDSGKRLAEVEIKKISAGMYQYLVNLSSKGGFEALEREVKKLNEIPVDF